MNVRPGGLDCAAHLRQDTLAWQSGAVEKDLGTDPVRWSASPRAPAHQTNTKGPPQAHTKGPPQTHIKGPLQTHIKGPPQTPQTHIKGPPQTHIKGPPQTHTATFFSCEQSWTLGTVQQNSPYCTSAQCTSAPGEGCSAQCSLSVQPLVYYSPWCTPALRAPLVLPRPQPHGYLCASSARGGGSAGCSLAQRLGAVRQLLA